MKYFEFYWLKWISNGELSAQVQKNAFEDSEFQLCYASRYTYQQLCSFLITQVVQMLCNIQPEVPPQPFPASQRVKENYAGGE